MVINMKKGSFEDLVHMLFENINRVKISFEEFQQLIDSAISFNENGIITEDKDLLIDLSEELVQYYMNNRDVDIDINQLKKFMKDSRHYSNIKNIKGGTLFLTTFNFDNDTEIKEFILKLYNINPRELQNEVAYFKAKQQKSNGFYYYDKANNKHICCANLKFNHLYETIYHELSHVIQKVCNIRITSSTEVNKDLIFNKLNKMKNDLRIDDDYISYLFNRYEYSTHVDDLILSLSNTYEMFYSNMSIFDFFHHIVLTSIQKTTSRNFLNCEFIENYKKVNDNDIQPIVMFYVSYYLNLGFYKISETVWKSLSNKY